MKILSKKSDSFVIQEGNYVVKVVPGEMADLLKILKISISNTIVLHHIKMRELDSNKVACFYQKHDEDQKRKLDFKTGNIQGYITLIYPQLLSLNLDSLEKKEDNYFGYIHGDPQINNYIVDNETGNILLIDLDAIIYDQIIYQPLYLLVKCSLDNRGTMNLFRTIFTLFFTNQMYLEDIINIGTKQILDLYITRLQTHKHHEYKYIENFINSEYDNLIQILDEIINK